jgi:hypothetical protein
MEAALLCAIAGIANEHTDRNTTADVQNWISKLEEDNRLIIHAAANAQRAADCILGESFEPTEQTAEQTDSAQTAMRKSVKPGKKKTGRPLERDAHLGEGFSDSIERVPSSRLERPA